MTADAEALRVIANALDQYQLFESEATVPIDALVQELHAIELRRPGSDVTVRALRECLYAVQDAIIADVTRRKK